MDWTLEILLVGSIPRESFHLSKYEPRKCIQVELIEEQLLSSLDCNGLFYIRSPYSLNSYQTFQVDPYQLLWGSKVYRDLQESQQIDIVILS